MKFKSDLRTLKTSITTQRFQLKPKDFYICSDEATENTNFDRHYVYHTAWGVRKLRESKPAQHVDIGSSVYFIALGSVVAPILFYDYRPAQLFFPEIETAQADLLDLHMADDSIPSLSCMHVVEHIGLGRYGDPIDYDGDLKAIGELKRVLQPGGNLFFVVPIGCAARIQFNAHRIYTYNQILDYFSDMELKEFSFIESKGNNPILTNYDPVRIEEKYGCGCFWFRKKSV